MTNPTKQNPFRIAPWYGGGRETVGRMLFGALPAMVTTLLFVGCAQTNPRLDCSDGVLDAFEACDDGNRTPGDGCNADCQIEAGFSCFGEPSVCQTGCGDGAIAGLEQCDDGNLLLGDGCDNACAVEPGFTCTGEPSVCTSRCGDGAMASTEGCDDGNEVGGDGCGVDCQVESGYACTGEPSTCEPVCGDGRILGVEGCDDGNGVGGDGCGADCQVESGYSCAGEPSLCQSGCGDGQVAGIEECDTSGQSATCDADCTLVVCGDGTLNTAAGEDCDSLQFGGQTCQTAAGFADGTLACTAQCFLDVSGCYGCGNGQVEGAEQCDGANVGSATCTTETSYTSGQLTCNSGCTGFDTSDCHTCGNGATEGPEACDGASLGSATCATETSYTSGQLTCHSGCTGFDTSNCHTCGNGTEEGSETCDDNNTSSGDGCSATCQTECDVDLTTTYNGGWLLTPGGQMFDIQALVALRITGLDTHLGSGSHNLEVYYRRGSYVGHETASGDWTLLVTAPTVTSAGNNNPTAIPFSGATLALAQNETVALYVTNTGSGQEFHYSWDTTSSAGEIHSADPQLRIRIGATVNYPFGPGLWSPRTWNGTVYYDQCP